MRRKTTGIVLVLVSGLLTALSLVSVVLVRLARFTAAADAARLEKVRADIVAESGMSYAASRLSQGIGYPLSILQEPSPDNRGDDWTFRDGLETDLANAVNVSYGHGEIWRETGGAPGTYDAGLDDVSVSGAWTDLDGDGKFSAWSGRLRGDGGGIKAPFALKIVAANSLFPVNFSATSVGAAAKGRLMRFGDNLGAVLLPPDGSVPERVDRAYQNGEPVRISALGRHLCENIKKGYSSIDEIRKTLAGYGYPPAAIDEVIPYIDLGPCDDSAGQGVYAVNLSTASPEILQALWVYASREPSGEILSYVKNNSAGTGGSGGSGGPGGLGGTGGPSKPPPGGPNFSEWLGSAYGSPGWRGGGDASYANSGVMIFPDEAALLAGWALEFRKTDKRSSWQAFRESLCARSRPDTAFSGSSGVPLFAADTAPLLAAGWGEAACVWARAKADAAFYAAFPDMVPTSDAPRNWGDWGIDPGPGAPPAGVVRHFLGVAGETGFDFPVPAGTGSWNVNPYTGSANSSPVAAFALTLAPPAIHIVETAARSGRASARASGRFRSAETIEFSSQEDFENAGLASAARWAARGITVLDYPNPGSRNWRRREVFDAVEDFANGGFVGPPAPFRGAVTGPVFNPNGRVQGYIAGIPVPVGADASRGFIGLAGRYTGNQGADLSWHMLADDTAAAVSVPEAEWGTQTRKTTVPAPDNLKDVNADNPWVFRYSNGTPGSSFSGASACTCWPFDFDPITNGDPAAGMKSWTVECWATGNTSDVFVLEGNAVQANGSEKLISIRINRSLSFEEAGSPPVWGPGYRYTATFRAPANSDVRVKNTAAMLVRNWANDDVYDFVLDAFVPKVSVGNPDPLNDRVDAGAHHVVLTFENATRNEDVNGNGTVDDWEDMNGDGDLVDPANTGPDFPGEDLWNDLKMCLYVDGKSIATASSLDGLKKNVKDPAWFRRGYPYPSFPYPMSRDVPGKRITYFAFNGDEVRLYGKDAVRRVSGITDADGDGVTDEVLKEPDARDRWKLGRYFLPKGAQGAPDNPEFVSPMYVFDSPVTLVCAGWTGLPTGDLGGGGGVERVGIDVKVGEPKNGPPLYVDGVSLSPTTQLTPPGAFSAMGPLTALGYSVGFFNLQPGNGQPLFETPLFEGVWMQVRRRGHSPAWIGRE